MKENQNINIQGQKRKKSNLFISEEKNKKTKIIEVQKMKTLTPSELILKKQNNELPLKFKMEPKIIEYLNTRDYTHFTNSKLPITKPIFEAIPPVIMFSDYEALKVQTMTLRLRNRDSVARRVKIIQPDTNLFKVYPKNEEESLSPKGNKVAPGLDLNFLIKFSPERKTDYHYKLVVVTEREKFVVPIIATGKKPLIVFPDEINFGNSCPVKYFSEKPVIIHNKGEKTTKWEIKLPKNFEANFTEGILEENNSKQLIIKFYPTERKIYQEMGKLLYDGDEAEFCLKGNAINGEVYLSKNYLQQEETYISLENRETFKIVNKSSVKIDFEWRAFSSEKEEFEKKKFLLDQLEKEEQEKRILIYETLDLEDNMQSVSNLSEDYDEIDEKEQLLKKRKKAEMLLDRKYKAIRKALEEDTLIFEDDIFSIQPIKGSIWPKSEMSITVIFKPKAALKYLHQAYCNISCSDQRLPLYLEGEGLGPKAFLSTNSLSISDIFVNDKQMFNIYIENKGEISARFKLIKNNTSFSKMIQFDIEEAELAVGQRMNIIMTFQSSKVGEFQELFKWKLEGSSEVLVLLVRGHVQAPKFEFSKKIIDFNKVSYQFEKTEELDLLNTSTVPFVFGLRIPQDGKGAQREFEIVPSNGTINPNETKKIKIKFVPHFRKNYKSVMVLDIEGIGRDMKSIPIVAESEVPVVSVYPDVLDFGKIFLRHKQTKEITLKNESSNLYARFIVHRLNPKYDSLGIITTDLDKGQIPPRSSVTINMTLTTMCIKKSLEMDFIIEIVSDKNMQYFIKIKANSTGPNVELSKKSIDFGDVEVLNKYVQKITLTNKSVIDADFFAFTKSQNSIFTPVQKHYILKPNQSFDVEVVCYADDQQKFKETLYFVIKEGDDKEVQLTARGVGNTIFCKDIRTLDFGTLYTYKTALQEVFLENKGRRVQNLRWQRKIEKNENTNGEVVEPTNVFSIYPETVCLPPKTGLMFQFKAYSVEIGKILEGFTLSSSIGNERKTTVLFTSMIQGEFIKPILKFSKKTLSFKYIWKKDQEPEIISKNLEIISSGPLPTFFSLHIEPPFEVFPKTLSLLPNKSGIIKIDFNPSGKKSRVSSKLQEKLHIKHNKHPNNESFDVMAEFCFPNLTLDTEQVNFGAVMNDTSKKTYVVIKNTSFITAEYEWFFIDDGIDHNIPINEVFDILPLRGKIEPGISEKVEFSYYAVPFCSFKLTAVCKVVGGPEYFVKINAEASDVAYNVVLPKNKNFLDVGEAFLDTKIIKDFELQNTSKVIFEYTVRLDSSSTSSKYMRDFIKISPSKGELAGGEKVKIKVSVIPAFPCDLNEHLILQVAHFEPERIFIKGTGIFPSLRFDAIRKFDNNLISYLEKRHGLDKNLGEEEWNEFFKNIKDSHLIQIEKFLIKNYIKKNFDKISLKNTTNLSVSSSKKLISRQSNSSRLMMSKSNFTKVGQALNFMEEIELGTYLLDMGTIIAGTKASKSITLYNIGNSNVSYSINTNLLNITGLSISNDKMMKLSFNKNNNSTVITFTLSTKKNTQAGIKNYLIPLKVKDGGKYVVNLIANINVPELKLSSSFIDFENILVGCCKIVNIRLENEKNIPCDYFITHIKKINNNKNQKKIVFSLNKTSGYLKPFSKANLEIKFEPDKNGDFEEKFLFQFKDSNRKLELVCKGEGIIPLITFSPPEINFEPCLPDTVLFKPLEIKNNSQFDIELLIPHLDVDFIKNHHMLKFTQENSSLKNVLNFKDPFWPEIEKEFEIYNYNLDIDSKIENLKKTEQVLKLQKKSSLSSNELHLKQKDEEKIDDIVQSFTELEKITYQIKELENQKKVFPRKSKKILPIPKEDRINLLIHSCYSGLAYQVSKFLASEHKKVIVDLSELYNFTLEEKIPLAKNIEFLLEEKLLQYENEQMEAKKKKNKKPLLSQEEFMYIEKNMFKDLLLERLKMEDCQSGVIFVNLRNKLLDLEKTLEIIDELCSEMNLIVIDVKEKKNKILSNSEIIGDDKKKSTEENENDQDDVSFEDLDFEERENENIVSFIFNKFDRKRSEFGRRSLILEAINKEENINEEFEIDKSDYENVRNWFKTKLKNLKQNIKENSEKIENEEFEHFEKEIEERGKNLKYDIKIKKEELKLKYYSINFPSNIIRLNFKLLEFLPTPKFPREEDLPLPDPLIEQRIIKPTHTKNLKNLKNFEILTYKDINGSEIENEEKTLTEENYLDYLENEKTRWVVPKQKSIFLAIKFTSSDINSLCEEITFESSVCCYNEMHKGWNLKLNGKTLFPVFNSNIVNIFPNRKKSKINKKGEMLKNVYLLKDKKFFFGPLLIVNKEKDDKRFLKKNYSSSFRFTNISPFAIKLKFRFQDIVKENQIEEEKNNKKNLKKKKELVEIEEEVYRLDKGIEEKILNVDETFELRVWAIPSKLGEFEKNLICEVENNPEPFIIPLSCLGVKPSLKLMESFLDFDKLIIKKVLTKKFTIQNNSLVSIKWRISNLTELLNCNFELSTGEGTLNVNEEKEIEITYKALKAEKIEKEIKIEVEDIYNQNIKGDDNYVIKVLAEGFDILVNFEGFSDPTKMILDFDKTLVNKVVEKKFKIKNIGLYPIDFELLFYKKCIADFFLLEPSKFELISNEEKEIKLKFLAQKEIEFKSADKKCFLTIRILEKKTKAVFNETRVYINALSQYSKFMINPLRQLNFGPIIFTEVRKRTFELQNTGLFEFHYDFFDLENKQSHSEILEKYKILLNGEEQKINNKKEKPKKKEDSLVLDLFTLTPRNGVLKPGETQHIEVEFRGKDNNWHEKKLGIELLNRNSEEEPEGLVYLLVGESCIPSIETNRFRNIFEEQLVTASLNSTGLNIQNVVQGNVFSIEDNTFYFGNIIPSKYPEGVTEKFKLINNGKVKVALNCDVKSKGISNLAFNIFPKNVTINPHEYVYIKLTFKPEIMSVYEATFEAVVIHDNKPLDCRFFFDVKGEGVLPTLKVMEIKNIIDFGKIRSDRTKSKKIIVKNIGVIPATAVCKLENQKKFRLISPPERTIMPQENYAFELHFKPEEKGIFENSIEFETVLNSYEKSKFAIKGEGYFEIVSFEGLEKEEDIIDFGDIVLRPESDKLGKKQFYLKNYSNSTIRFEWKNFPVQYNFIKISPQLGHIGPGMKKIITVRVNKPDTDKSLLLDVSNIVNIEQIQLDSGLNMLKQRQWDNMKQTKRIVSEKEYYWMKECESLMRNYEDEMMRNKKTKKPILPEKPEIVLNDKSNFEIVEFVKEPNYKLLDNEKKNISLIIKAKIDAPNFSCETQEIYFKKTTMFCSRSYSLKIKNLSLIKLRFYWEFYDEFSGTNDPGYFSITEQTGVIEKEDIKEFILRFNPTECNPMNSKRMLFFKVTDTTLQHKINLFGDTDRPICHFELPNIASENQEKIIEMESLGYNNKNIKKFYILNPTALSYEFSWDFDHTTNSYIKCLTPKGTILSGKKFEAKFEFLPTKNCPDKYKKNFTFRIPNHNIEHNFLFIAKVLQPKIFFSKAKLDFGALMIDAKGKEVIMIKNLDNIPYKFNFVKSTIKGGIQSHFNSLLVSPLSGVVEPQSEIPISINLLPKLEINYNFNLICNIVSKKDPLNLNIKGIGYKLHHSVFVKDKLINPHFKHQINFGDIFVNENSCKSITLVNNGEFNFDFVVVKKNNPAFVIKPENGSVHKNEKIEIEIYFEPQNEIKLETIFKLNIISGPTYKFEVKGNALLPQLEIKPSLIDFGYVLVPNNPVFLKKEIKFINHDKKTLTLDTDFVQNDFLKIKLAPSQSILPFKNNPSNVITVPVHLNLRKLGKFKEKIDFFINNNHKVNLVVKGEGVPLSLELEKAQDINLDLGELRPGQKILKEVRLFNNSKIPVYMDFNVDEQLSQLFKLDLALNPQILFIPPKSSGVLDVVFSPRQRLRNFSLPIFYSLKECAQKFELLSIKGACYDVEVKLMEDFLDFGDVVVNSSLVKKFTLVNLGDINAEFNWDLGFMEGYFSIFPLEGVLSSNQRKTFECTFRPKSYNPYNLTCKLHLKNSEEVLKLKLKGNGTNTHPDSIQTVNFQCPVREKVSKTVDITNNTDSKWIIEPSLTFEKNVKNYFKVQEKIEIDPKMTTKLEITYNPLTINPKLQRATLFLPLKDGKAILHNLIGTALTPNPEERIKIELESKKNSYFTLNIKNWLNKPQRLESVFTIDDKDPIEKGVIINSAETIDLSPGDNQNYKIAFNVLKQGDYVVKAVFKNLKTEEFIFYIFDLKVASKEVLKTIEMFSSVRDHFTQIILLDNPLSKDVNINAEDVEINTNCVFVKSQFPLILKKNLDFGLELIYRPLLVFENKECILTIKSNELGIFRYKLLLNSKKNNNIQTLNFKGKIGDSNIKPFSFTNYLTVPSQYTCTIERLGKNDTTAKGNPDFTLQNTNFSAKPAQNFNGCLQTLEIKYEPSILGMSKALLTIINKDGGEYQAYLIGNSSIPLPKGPFKISPKGFAIEFKNPFFESREFFISTDNPCFTFNSKSPVKLDAKKIVNINVIFKYIEGADSNGRLIVESNDDISWVFYLQGMK